MTTDLDALRRQAAEADKAARDARKKLEAAEFEAAQARMAPLRALVKRAHDCLCGWNHTDGCAWGYEEDAKDPWACSAHARWLGHYDQIINGDGNRRPEASFEQVERIIASMEVLKKEVGPALHLLRRGLTP